MVETKMMTASRLKAGAIAAAACLALALWAPGPAFAEDAANAVSAEGGAAALVQDSLDAVAADGLEAGDSAAAAAVQDDSEGQANAQDAQDAAADQALPASDAADGRDSDAEEADADLPDSPEGGASAQVAQEASAGQDVVLQASDSDEPAAPAATVTATVHMQREGWHAAATAEGGQVVTAGSAGKGIRLEALQLKVASEGVSGHVSYAAYVQGTGWQAAKKDGATAGTSGQSKAIEAVKATLSGTIAQYYDLFYRAYVANVGWLAWTSGNAPAGTTGFDRRLEALQFQLVAKGDDAPGEADAAGYAYVAAPKVSVQAHVQRKGWLAAVDNNAIAGTTGQALRMEALKISVTSAGKQGDTVYDAHVQRIGWQPEVENGALSGTTGQALRMEAVHLDVTDDLASVYDVYYRVHIQGFGWLDWATAGQMAGSMGKAKRLEAIQVLVTMKGDAAPGSTYRPALKDTYVYLDAGHGYSGAYGYDVGAQGGGYTEATETKELVNKIAYYAQKTYGLKVYDNTTAGKAGVNYSDRQADAQSRGCSSFVSIHFNASGGAGTGTESYSYTTGGSKLQSIVHPYLVQALGLVDRGQKSYPYAVVRGSVPATLLEICFIDNASDMARYKARETAVAQAIAKGIYEATVYGF